MAEPGGERPQLRAAPAPAAELPAAGGKPVYADVTGEAQRRPILPQWAQRGNFAPAVARWRGRLWHEVRFHGLRLPVYGAKSAFWSVAGAVWLFVVWLQWWLMPVPVEAHVQAVGEGWRAWRTVHREHKQTAKVRFWISAGVGVAGLFAFGQLWIHLRLVAGCVTLAGLFAAARFGRPEGVRIVQAAHVPSELVKLTPEVVSVALGSIGISGIDRHLREGGALNFPHPVRQDGPGWRAEVELPRGVTATMVIERRDRFASGLRRPLGAVWPEPMRDEHPGLLEVWVGQHDVTKTRQPPWPLLKGGKADVFAKVPLGTDPRHRPVGAPLFEVNWCIGAAPGQGKTNTVRLLTGFAALDPLAVPWVHELAGKGDLDAGRVAHRYVSGLDDEAIAYTAESVTMLRGELEDRSARFKALPKAMRPEGKLTRELAQRDRRLRPLVCVIDECQNLFLHPKLGAQAAEDLAHVIRLGRAYGIIVILSTQRPDSKALPTPIRGVVTARFCLQVPDQDANDMILGTGAYRAGYNAVTFRPKTDAGLGWLKADTSQQVVRTYKLDLEPFERVIERGRVLRQQAGLLTGYALGEDDGSATQDVLGDVLVAFGADGALQWEMLAGRLAQRFPDRWAGATADSVSARLRDLQVPVRQVKRDGINRNGCRKADIERMGVLV
jgi:S-DNA-T family DNA segregation ATPase FtsK/SpoIIIE